MLAALLIGASLAAAPAIPDRAGDRARELAIGFVDAIGPRPAATSAGDRAQVWVADALEARGWTPRTLRTVTGAVVACRPGDSDRVALFLAHTDSVARDVPGGNDNAAAVGVLLAVAELLPQRAPRTVCLGFPDGEEVGLRGSFALAEAARAGFLGGPVDQVLALDLVGIGRLTHNGLGPAFGAARLRALVDVAPAEVPWVYRAISQAYVERERSDHLPFTLHGIPASHLMARGPSGVDFAYHTPSDTPDRLEPATLHAAVAAVVGIALAPPLPDEAPGSPAFVVPFTAIVVPGAITWALLALSLPIACLGATPDAGVRRASVPASAVGWVVHAIAATAAMGVALIAAVGARRMDLALAGPAACAAWAAWGAVAVGAPVDPDRRAPRVLGAVAALAMAGLFAWHGAPLLALPFAVAGAGVAVSRWTVAGAVLAAWPAAFLLRPDAIRELHFHHLFPAEPAWWTAVGAVVTLPLLGAVAGPTTARRQRIAATLAVLAVVAIAVAWTWPEQRAPYLDLRGVSSRP